ncbi:addiction module antidote protein [Cohaesibacter celericrescens]|uniref:Putative addiction module antidote protein n=1 Tax=Cohaesibacter celericrescens TaxID=2067669 RepID=A0A2N5XRK2_9HYPH|nr:addiction module antidote protein [Cohaesibacter celericrescens]PLW77124.1 putative addiction module antidote protein [Cohaesibacter celericrescens]
MVIETTPYDVCDYLNSDEEIKAYLDEALASNDSKLIAHVLGNVARKIGMKKIAETTGLSRESLYKSLSDKGNPELATIIKVLNAIGHTLKTDDFKQAS